MRGAHSIDVQAFHRLNVFFHLFGSDGTAVDGREIVTVHTVEHHALAIDGQGTITADGHLLEAYLSTSDIDSLTFGILQREHKVVEVGRLSTPQLRMVDRQVEG